MIILHVYIYEKLKMDPCCGHVLMKVTFVEGEMNTFLFLVCNKFEIYVYVTKRAGNTLLFTDVLFNTVWKC